MVVATGMETEFGKIASMTQAIPWEKTSLAQMIDRLGKNLGMMTVGVAVIVVIIGIFQMRDLLEMFLIGITLAVAVIPEGLPAVVTLSLAIGLKRLYQRKCLVRHLAASETLGSVSVICTDKTGTLTRNERMVQKIALPDGVLDITGSGYEPKGEFLKEGKVIPRDSHGLQNFLKAALLSSNAHLVEEDGAFRNHRLADEGALVVAAHKAGIVAVMEGSTPEQEFSFDSTRKRKTVIYREKQRGGCLGKGGSGGNPGAFLRMFSNGKAVPIPPKERKRLAGLYESMARNG
ncbi:MAG: HAD-IC family P-type ATPase [Methanomicrobiales archaeon]|nr:HAD-IC family P-type ATPase [Methanomicrobiales archaeon]